MCLPVHCGMESPGHKLLLWLSTPRYWFFTSFLPLVLQTRRPCAYSLHSLLVHLIICCLSSHPAVSLPTLQPRSSACCPIAFPSSICHSHNPKACPFEGIRQRASTCDIIATLLSLWQWLICKKPGPIKWDRERRSSLAFTDQLFMMLKGLAAIIMICW